MSGESDALYRSNLLSEWLSRQSWEIQLPATRGSVEIPVGDRRDPYQPGVVRMRERELCAAVANIPGWEVHHTDRPGEHGRGPGAWMKRLFRRPPPMERIYRLCPKPA